MSDYVLLGYTIFSTNSYRSSKSYIFADNVNVQNCKSRCYMYFILLSAICSSFYI